MLFLLHAGLSWAANIQVSADRNPVYLDESFTLTFTAEESPNDDPDFSPLENDFEILGRSQSNQMSINNGRYSRRTEWQLTVMPKREGTLTVPPIPFGKDRSEPLTVRVVRGSTVAPQAAANADVFLEVEAKPNNPYVQAQVLYAVRVFSRVNFAGGGELSEPTSEDALIQRLGDDHQYMATRNGLSYKVIERKYALFPQKSGRLRIEPLSLETQILAGGGRSLFSPFFSQTTRPLRVRSDAVELQVRGIPAAFSGKHWLPAENLDLDEAWSSNIDKIMAGEPVTRTLTLRAQGATVGLLPELNVASAAQDGINRYPDQPLLNEEKLSSGISSVRQEKTALIPAEAGAYRLSALEIPWWNTQTDRMEIAKLPERILKVVPSSQPAAPSTPRFSPAPEKAQPRNEPVLPAASSPASSSQETKLWFWLSCLLALAWLSTLIAWWRSRQPRKIESMPKEQNAPTTERQIITALKQACQSNDPVQARRALLQWAENHWTQDRLLSLDELERFFGGELGSEIQRLNQQLYGRSGENWQGETFWQSFQRQAKSEVLKKTRSQRLLEPLHKLEA
jgi:hypothetical protein